MKSESLAVLASHSEDEPSPQRKQGKPPARIRYATKARPGTFPVLAADYHVLAASLATWPPAAGERPDQKGAAQNAGLPPEEAPAATPGWRPRERQAA